ncbi:hypothetical protein BCR36DRAFT_371763 [Piromyces finnis]|uniref:Zinc finger HIT domain-containing protein n=1 Tax=Piromyces finnis TaxID=1754191 RepID=A0A1Y1V4N8_9FUNG|nr:hypothetical protein BCR36DRAFT_371763 [Piromyces finnis]|eukprot:ORX47276.1 hypothetical protein BCR36DRAFT_371763 [Piromyces finnis]
MRFCISIKVLFKINLNIMFYNNFKYSYICLKLKENPCKKPETTTTVKIESEKKEEKKDEEDEEYLTKVSEEKLKQLGQSKEIRDLLQYEQLKELLKEIDDSSKPEQLYDQAFNNNPLFKEFVDKSLAIIDNEENNNNNN